MNAASARDSSAFEKCRTALRAVWSSAVWSSAVWSGAVPSGAVWFGTECRATLIILELHENFVVFDSHCMR